MRAREGGGRSRRLHLPHPGKRCLSARHGARARGGRTAEAGVSPYDYTVYSCAAGLHSLRYYWTSYRNPQVRFADLAALRGEKGRAVFAVDDAPAFAAARREGTGTRHAR